MYIDKKPIAVIGFYITLSAVDTSFIFTKENLQSCYHVTIIRYNELYILDTWNKFKSSIYISLFFTTLSVKLFVVTVQIFVYKFLYTIVFFGERKIKPHKIIHILKMKTTFEKDPHFENENTFRKRTTFWESKLPSKGLNCYCISK